jgi:hypothetical protein
MAVGVRALDLGRRGNGGLGTGKWELAEMRIPGVANEVDGSTGAYGAMRQRSAGMQDLPRSERGPGKGQVPPARASLDARSIS